MLTTTSGMHGSQLHSPVRTSCLMLRGIENAKLHGDGNTLLHGRELFVSREELRIIRSQSIIEAGRTLIGIMVFVFSLV